MKRRTPETSPGGLDLLEEVIHTLRGASLSTLLCYYTGSAPFVLGLLFFWSDMSRSGLAEQHLVGGAIGLSFLFIWMKVWQARFTLRLSAQLTNQPVPGLSAGDWLRAIGAQTLLHSTGLFVLPVAAQILLPLGWVYAFYQNVTVLGFREPSLRALIRRSWKQARYAPMQAHTALLLIGLFSLFIFLDVIIVLLSLPHLLKMLTGTESTFTLSAASSLNSTFLMAAVGVTYLCLDPLLKCLFTLRCFYGESRATGEDLRVTLRNFRPAAAALLMCAFLIGGSTTSAAAPKIEIQPPASERGTELNRSIDEILKRPEYTWRAPRVAEDKPKEKPTLLQRVREWMRDVMRRVGDYFDKLFRGRTSVGPGKFSFSPEGLIYILIGLVLAIIGVLAWLLWKTRSRHASAELTAAPAAPVPDLASEDVAGNELPVDGWTKLALELLERGELRLAMRAFYFSSLAHLAERNLVSIAKFKSNRDYERELQRRSHALPGLPGLFSDNVSVFDRVWYGLHEINAELLQQFRTNVERIRAC